jgi:hypothetical protein
MAGYQENVGLWRLTAEGDGAPIPYKFLGMEGGFSYASGDITAKVLIPANRLEDFLEFIFPPPITNGTLEIPVYRPLPGIPSMVAVDFSFASQLDKPVDPFVFDTGAPSGTYHEILALDIHYTTWKTPNRDPRSFLEISSNASGEFIHTTAPGAQYKPKSNNTVDTDGDGKPDLTDVEIIDAAYYAPGDIKSGTFIDPDTGETKYGNITILPNEPIKDPSVPITIFVPTTEWTARWPRVDYEFFHDTFIHRLKVAMDRETLLFVGYNVQENITWRRGQINKPPVSVDMKFVEKNVDWKAVSHGHNSVWKPSVGWTKIVLNSDTPETTLYQEWDLNRLFKQD